ncbi:hypothetical protein CY35_09G010800 [Sphagnum magellanicum]|nr:hypothetical protein CY35_09G010800 [Sphagnum magellanicum]
MAVAPPPSCFGDSLFSHWPLGSPFPSLSSSSLLPLSNDSACPVALGSGPGAAGSSSTVAMAAAAHHQSLFFNSSGGGGDTAATGLGGSWNFEPFVSENYYTLGTNLQTVVESMYPPAVDDYLTLGSCELDSSLTAYGPSVAASTMSSSSAGCSTSTVMHPNLVSTLKSMVQASASDHAGTSSSGLQASTCSLNCFPAPLFETQQPDPMQAAAGTLNTHIAFSQLFDPHLGADQRNLQPSVFAASENSCITSQQQHSLEPMIKQEMEKSSDSSAADDNMEAAVVPVDLIQNRRPFRCGHDGCNKTFKNPQTMKMHHKTHYADGRSGAASRSAASLGASSAQSVTAGAPSLKAGQNKKIPSRCPKCKKTFVGLYELRRHYGRKHSEGEKGFGCRKCGKKFYIEVDVRDHEKLCGESIACKCGLKFAFKCNLVAHKKAHPACQDNHGAAASATTTSSDDSASDQSRGNSPGTAPAGLKLQPSAGTASSRSVAAGSKQGSSSRRNHKQQQQQQEVASSPHLAQSDQQLIIPPLPDFSEDFRQSPQYNLLSYVGMDVFPVTSSATAAAAAADTSIWPSSQYMTEFMNSTSTATQLHSFTNFGAGMSCIAAPMINPGYFTSSRSNALVSEFPQSAQQQDHSDMMQMFAIKAAAGSNNLLEDLVGSSSGYESAHHVQLIPAPQLPATAALSSMQDRLSAAAYCTSTSVCNFQQALNNRPYGSYM